MACIEKIYSVSVVVGSSNCNAKCKHCGGRSLRSQGLPDGEVARNLIPACRLATRYGAWALALTSSGEPTLSPNSITNTLKLVWDAGLAFPFTNLFTNGIKMADEAFADKWLPVWKSYGLTSVAISIHTTDHLKNSLAYGLSPSDMPTLENMIKNIKKHGLCPRITLLLGKENTGTAKQYVRELDTLHDMGVKLITSWSVVANDGSRISATPDKMELLKIKWWMLRNTDAVMGHVWGGMVRNYKGMNIRLTDYVSKHSPSNDFIRQLVVFQNGEVSYSWFQPGNICLA